LLGEPKNRISEKALKVWKIHGWITSVISLAICIGLGVLVYINDWPIWIFIVLALLWPLETYFFTFLIPSLRWRRWRYEVREQEIEIQHGVFIVTQTLVPMIRVQHVDNTQGPILKKYNLSTVKIHTAATVHEIPALEVEEAESLRKTIARLARVADEDV